MMNESVYNLPRTTVLTDRITQLFEPALAKHILPLTGAEDRMNLSLTGAISDHTYSRFDRNQIFVYVNQRWIKNYKLAQAVIKGYQNILQPQKYPAGVLFITLDPQQSILTFIPVKKKYSSCILALLRTLLKKVYRRHSSKDIVSNLLAELHQNDEDFAHGPVLELTFPPTKK